MQPYVIPTGSLEKTLLVGDFLFVSKFHYGARAPMTSIAAPMVHDTLPVLGVRSYLNSPQLPYFRLPGFQDIKRNEIVVFSWPADTVRIFFKKEKGVKKPIDKKSNYVKRCVGLPGDSLSVVNGYVYINGERTSLPGRARPQYTNALFADKGVSSRLLLDAGITEFNRKYLSGPLNQTQLVALQDYLMAANQNTSGEIELYTNYRGIPPSVVRKAGLSLREVTDRERYATMTDGEAEVLRKANGIDSVVKQLQPAGQQGPNIFPQDQSYPWNNDNFGPIYLPEAGKTVALNLKVLPLYKKIIRDYEGNTLSVSGNQVLVNGEPADSYTFKQDYYWMMGDNRHRSEDSRTWGYVPANHIVGKPVFIWMSIEGINDGISNWKPRWNRFFTTVHGDGEPRSYFRYFLVLLAGWFIFDYIRKRRKKSGS
jgi:signal peptidase I